MEITQNPYAFAILFKDIFSRYFIKRFFMKPYKGCYLIFIFLISGCALGPPMTMAKGRYSSFQELERDANYQCQIKYGDDAKARRLNPDSWDT